MSWPLFSTWLRRFFNIGRSRRHHIWTNNIFITKFSVITFLRTIQPSAFCFRISCHISLTFKHLRILNFLIRENFTNCNYLKKREPEVDDMRNGRRGGVCNIFVGFIRCSIIVLLGSEGLLISSWPTATFHLKWVDGVIECARIVYLAKC